MTFKDAVRITLKEKYLSIEGRAPRSEYWYFVLFCVLASFALGALDAILFGLDSFSPLSLIFSLLIFLPTITVGVRRLHDRDMSGWWMLLTLLPLIGTVVLLVLFLMSGTVGANTFGPDPLGDDSSANWAEDDENISPSSIPRVDRE